jgi:hypothetical protein
LVKVLTWIRYIQHIIPALRHKKALSRGSGEPGAVHKVTGDVDIVKQAAFAAPCAVDEEFAKCLPIAINVVGSTGLKVKHHLRCPCKAKLLPENSLGNLIKPLTHTGHDGYQPWVPVKMLEDKEKSILTQVALDADAMGRMSTPILFCNKHFCFAYTYFIFFQTVERLIGIDH